MKIRSFLYAVAGLSLVGMTPVRADPAATTQASDAAPAASDAAAKPVDHSQDIICKRVEVTGSHLSKDRVCKTRKVWAQEEQENDDTNDNNNRMLESRGSTNIPR